MGKAKPRRRIREAGMGRRGAGRAALDWVVTIAVALVIAVLLRTFVFEVYIVPSGSMLETIQ